MTRSIVANVNIELPHRVEKHDDDDVPYVPPIYIWRTEVVALTTWKCCHAFYWPDHRLEMKQPSPMVVTPNIRDCGTTMWCPMKCCRQHFCGVSPTDGKGLQPLEEKDKMVTPVPYPMQPSPRTIETTISFKDDTITTPPPLPKTPPPTKERLHQKEDYQVASRNYDYDRSSSSSSSSQELSYTYMEDRREFDLHDWYNNLDVMEHYYRARRTNVQTSNKQLQTDIESTASTTSTSDIHHIIATTDKAVSTTEFQMKPINIVSQCKSSSLKPQRPNQRPLSRSQIKVKFEEENPKVANVGTNPMLESSLIEMPIPLQRRGQKLNTLDETLDRKTAGKQEESTWYRVASGSYYLPPYKGYPTCWS
ncbi:uncharacterized protein [Drosophila tropicalis]|uniref:uncharacterized protein isoform X2 n=1 Tax=Drosophila tropicalis TaxID=46794 RepID=UPI0035ABC42B